MAEQNDLEQLAKQYLDLWQDHLRATARDPQVGQTLSQMTQIFTGSAAAFAALAQQALAQQNMAQQAKAAKASQPAGTDADDRTTANQDSGTGRNSGAAAAAAAHGGGHADLAELDRRLADIERRLAALETGGGGPGGAAEKRPRRRKS